MTGVDVPIALMRDDFAASLWTDVPKRIFYSKAYRNQRKGNLIPEVFTGSDQNNEYEEVMFSDEWNVLVFFDAPGTRANVRDEAQITIEAYIAVNLRALYPDATWRAEEDAHRDVVKVLEQSRSAYPVKSIEVTAGLDAYGDFFTENVKGFNMQPYHVFRVDIESAFMYDCDDGFISTQLRVPGFVYPDPIIF